MGVTNMTKAEREIIDQIKALEVELHKTMSWARQKDLKKRITRLKLDLNEYRKLMYDNPKANRYGVSEEDFVNIRKLYANEGLGFEELEQYFGGKYRYSQIRTIILEWLKGGN